MDDRQDPERSPPRESEISPPRPRAEARSNVVPLRPDPLAKSPERLNSRLEEMRHILAQSEPYDKTSYSDDEVIDDERKFRKRFGPGFSWNQRDRIGLIDLKRRYDLTDPEIRLFEHTGNLKRTVFGVFITANPWIALLGGVEIAYFGLLLIALLIAVWSILETSPAKAIKLVLAVFVLVGFCVALYWVFMKPWFLQRRKERERRDE